MPLSSMARSKRLRERYGLTAEAALEKARPYLIALESKRLTGVRG